MTARPEIYDRLADLYRYPDEGYAAGVERCHDILKSDYPEAESTLAGFSKWIASCGRAELEEIFSRTFDLNPACCAEIGWHLFGERYDRGSFLVWLRSRLRETGVEEIGELPDHLVHVLPLLSRLDEEEAGKLARQAIQPAVRKMESCLKEDNAFRMLITATGQIIASDFGPGEPGSAEPVVVSMEAGAGDTSGRGQ